jgi:hypothetical protein
MKTVYINSSNGAPLVSERPDIDIITSIEAGGHDQATAPELPKITTQRLTVLVNYSGDGTISQYIRLPSNSEIGDEAKLIVPANALKFGLVGVFPPIGEEFIAVALSSDGSADAGGILKKFSPTQWGFV